jgi:transcription elongation GreA/GreB family factor
MRIPKRRGETDREALAGEPDAFLTPEAIERMKKTLVRLEKTDRPEAANEMRRTAEMGDLSENAAYQHAKMQLRRINSRILSIEEKIKRAIPIPAGSGGDGHVRIGSTVTLEANGRELTFQVLGSQETNPLKGRISYLSPLGAALMGKAAGETVTMNAEDHPTEYRVLKVE